MFPRQAIYKLLLRQGLINFARVGTAVPCLPSMFPHVYKLIELLKTSYLFEDVYSRKASYQFDYRIVTNREVIAIVKPNREYQRCCQCHKEDRCTGRKGYDNFFLLDIVCASLYSENYQTGTYHCNSVHQFKCNCTITDYHIYYGRGKVYNTP